MVQTHKKRSLHATANSPMVLSDMGEIYFINLVNFNHSSNKALKSNIIKIREIFITLLIFDDIVVC